MALDGLVLERMRHEKPRPAAGQAIGTPGVSEETNLSPRHLAGESCSSLHAPRAEETTSHRLNSMVSLISIRVPDDFFSSFFTSSAAV